MKNKTWKIDCNTCNYIEECKGIDNCVMFNLQEQEQEQEQDEKRDLQNSKINNYENQNN